MKNLQEVIRSRCTINPATGCWIWDRACNAHGYGVMWWEGKLHRVNRLSFIAFNGPLAPGECSLHSCDTPPCANPEHLFKGTRGDNSADMVKKHRSAAGERHSQAKLTAAQVEEIRQLSARGGLTTEQIGARFGVCGTAVSRIVNGHRWGRVAS